MRISASDWQFWISRAILAILLSFVAFYTNLMSSLSADSLCSASGILAQISATMLGFVMAALAILATISNSLLVRNMKKTGHYHVLLRRLFVSVGALSLVTIAGIIVIFFPAAMLTYAYVILGLCLFSVFLLWDSFRKFWIVLHNLHPAP